jgi:hypothetical protein
MVLKVSGVGGKTGLLPEIVRASEILAGEAQAANAGNAPAAEGATPDPAKKTACRACGSERLHAQHGRFGYFYRCIDCTENTPMNKRCAGCGKRGARAERRPRLFPRVCPLRHLGGDPPQCPAGNALRTKIPRARPNAARPNAQNSTQFLKEFN